MFKKLIEKYGIVRVVISPVSFLFTRMEYFGSVVLGSYDKKNNIRDLEEEKLRILMANGSIMNFKDSVTVAIRNSINEHGEDIL